MSAERSFEAWEEVQRHGLDFADRLAHGFTGLIHSHHISPPSLPKLFDLDLLPSSSFVTPDFKLAPETINSSILDIGSRIGQARTDFGNCLNGFLQQFFRGWPLSVPSENFRLDEAEESGVISVRDLMKDRGGAGLSLTAGEETGFLGERFRDFAFVNGDDRCENSGCDDEVNGEDAAGFSVQGLGRLGKPQVMGTCGDSFLFQRMPHTSASS